MAKSALAPHSGLSVSRQRGCDAAAPLVGEQHLGAVVAEGRRVPERHVDVGDLVDADRIGDFADVEQQPVAAARAAGKADVGIDGDVMALIRSARRTAGPATAARRRHRRGRTAAAHLPHLRRTCRTCTGAPAAPAPATCRTGVRAALGRLDAARRRRETVEDARRAHDRRLLRRRERHPDHFDAEARASSDRRCRRRSSPAVRPPSGRPTDPTRRCRRSPCRADRSRPYACASRGTSARW